MPPPSLPPLAQSPKVAGPVVELTPEMAIAASRRPVKDMESKASLRRVSASFMESQPSSSSLFHMEMDQPSASSNSPVPFFEANTREPPSQENGIMGASVDSTSDPAPVKDTSTESAVGPVATTGTHQNDENELEQKPDQSKANSWWFWSSPMEIAPVNTTITTTSVTTTTTMTTTVTHTTMTSTPIRAANKSLQSIEAGAMADKLEEEHAVENTQGPNNPISALPDGSNTTSNTFRSWGLGWFYSSSQSSSTSPEKQSSSKPCEKPSAHPAIEELPQDDDQHQPKQASSSSSISLNHHPRKQSVTAAEMDIKPKASTDKHELHQQHQQQDILSSSVSSKNSARKRSIWSGLFLQSNQSSEQLPSTPSSTTLNGAESSAASTHSTDQTPDHSDTDSKKPTNAPSSPSIPSAGSTNGSVSGANGTKKRKSSMEPLRPNLVLPALEDNFPIYSTTRTFKTSLKKFTSSWFAGSKIDTTGSNTSGDTNLSNTWANPGNATGNHLYRNSSPKRVSRVVVVGVHGFFPMKMLRSLIGEPTGTSLKFATEGARAFEEYGRKHGMTITVDKIALEGEGKVWSRVDSLYKRLLEYIELIEGADCVFFAAHSQGTPVAAHLLARLVEDGHVDGKTIGMVGMAGISLGPFSGLDQTFMVRAYSSIESSSLGELFQFQDPTSVHSRKYVEALRTIIAHNAKILFVGSINDQVVPLYSATCMHVTHPNILRAVYVDGSNEVSPEFISNLVGLALRLKNVGCSEHGLIKEISASLAGSLRGGGHSRIYDEQSVYELAIRHLLETTDPDPALPVAVDTDFQVPPRTNHNPYLLPWSLHGMFTEAAARTRLRPALHELIREFRAWAPESKSLKDIKYRLSAVQAKLWSWGPGCALLAGWSGGRQQQY